MIRSLMNPSSDESEIKTYFLGVDDTDNLLSRGTGFKARELGNLIVEKGLGVLNGVTRHQLLVDPSIPYTSHNSSACLEIFSSEDRILNVSALAEKYLAENSAPGSDAGMCLVESSLVDQDIIEFGKKAKESVVDKESAMLTGKNRVIAHKGLTGDHGGVIGALAAVGLRATGNDGRFIWAKGVRDLTGIYRAGILLEETGIDVILSIDGEYIGKNEKIDVDPWPRPVLLNNKATLLVEKSREVDQYDWRIIGKEYIKRF